MFEVVYVTVGIVGSVLSVLGAIKFINFVNRKVDEYYGLR